MKESVIVMSDDVLNACRPLISKHCFSHLHIKKVKIFLSVTSTEKPDHITKYCLLIWKSQNLSICKRYRIILPNTVH